MKQWMVRSIALILMLTLTAFPAHGAQEGENIPEGVLYAENFESGGMDGWVSYEEKSGVVETEEGHAYCVRSYDYNSKTVAFSDYVFQFEWKVDYKEPGTTAPAFYVRRGADGSRYEMYIDSAGGRMVVDRVINEEKTSIGEAAADFAADNLTWVTLKIVLSGKNIWIYYKDMETPVAKLRDETPLTAGGIGFGFGNTEFLVDNITISELAEPVPEPYEISPEEQKDYKDSPYREEIDQLIAFGIVNAFDDGTFRPDNAITRAEFAALTVRARNVQTASGGALTFRDVDPASWAAPVISTACAMGYMAGFDAETFAPEESITMEQAAKVLVRLIGGEVLAERRGGYPSGYMAYAAQRGITEGVSKIGSEPLSRGEVAKLFANTVKLDILRQTGYGDMEEYRTDEGVTLLSEYRGIYPFKGRVTANYYAGIYADESLGKNEFLLDGLVIETGKTQAAEQLGYCVKLYAHKDETTGRHTAVWFAVDEAKSDALVIAAEDILDVSGLERLSYREEESGREREAELSKNTNLILNGGSGTFCEENMQPEAGQLTLFDTNGDGVYETVLAESYRTMVVGNVSAQTRRITDKFDPAVFAGVDEKDAEIVIRRGYQDISLDAIAPLEVVSIAETEARAAHRKITILASEKKISGRISEFEENGGWETVIVKGKEYPVSPYLRRQIDAGRAEELVAGVNVTLRLDSFGNVAYAEMKRSSDFMLLNGVMWENGADSGWLAELFDSDGEWRKCRLKEKLVLNGREITLAQDNMPEELTGRQIVRVKFAKDGKIAVIETEHGGGALVKNRVYDEWPMEYISASRSFDTDSYVDENTLVFAVPYHTDEKENYFAGDSSYFRNGSTYRLWSYNEDKFEVADIILVFEKEDSGGNGKLARPFFFERMTRAVDAEGNEIRKLSGYREGQEVSFVLADGVSADFTCGDALTLSQNGKGEVVAYQHLYRADSGAIGSDNNGFGMSSDRVTVCGTVLDFDAATGRLLLDVGVGQTREKAFLAGAARQVYCCLRSKGKIYLSTVNEICVGDFVVMDFSWNELRDIMIYR